MNGVISDFLKPPTDNLYKFMCISGLILVLLSITFPPWQINKIRHSYLENKRDLEILQVDSETIDLQASSLTEQASALNRDRRFLSEQLETLRGNTDSKRPLTETDKAMVKNELERLESVRGRLEQKDKEWLEKMTAVASARADHRKRLIEIKYKNEAALWDARSATAISTIALFTGLLGFWLGRKGFKLWSSRVQVYQDAILKKQAEESAK